MAQGDFRETAFNYIVGDKIGTFFSSEQKHINKIAKLAILYPNEVKIVHESEDGSIVAKIPVKWFKISPPRKVSDEQKEAASLRFKQMWKDKENSEINENENIDDIYED